MAYWSKAVTKTTRARRRRSRASRFATSKPVRPGIWTSRNADVGRERADDLEGADAVAGLADDLDASDLAEQEAQFFAGRLLVVDDDRAEFVRSCGRARRARRDRGFRCAPPCPGRARSSAGGRPVSP